MEVLGKRKGRGALFLLKFLGSAAGVGLLALMAFVLARASWGMYGKFVEASAASETAAQELQSLREKQARMEAAVGALSTPRGLEAEVRARFGVARPGEGEIKIVRDSESENLSPQESASFWGRMFKAFRFW